MIYINPKVSLVSVNEKLYDVEFRFPDGNVTSFRYASESIDDLFAHLRCIKFIPSNQPKFFITELPLPD